MAFDKDQIEQEAMKLLSKGQTDKALVKYQELLRHDPRDRRIRQRLAEMYLKVGRHVEAEKHFREIVKHMMSSGQEKGAISVLKQVVRLKKDDPEALEQLGDCYVASGFPKDARSLSRDSRDFNRKGCPLTVQEFPKEELKRCARAWVA